MKQIMKKKSQVSIEMDLKPFMNLMVVLIPMLLLSAEFTKVAIIDISLPEDSGSQTENKNDQKSSDDTKSHLKLTAFITDSVVTLGAKGGFLPSIHYKEYHHYIARDDQAEFTVEYLPGEKIHHPKTGREMLPQERSNILLFACDENRNIMKGLYTENDELLIDENGVPVKKIRQGETVYTLSNPRRSLVINTTDKCIERNINVYDVLCNKLMKLNEKYHDLEDAHQITIAAENSVVYDKIVQMMDSARKAEYSDIQISKIRS